MSSAGGSGPPRRSARRAPGWLAPLIVVAVIAVDQLTKVWVVAALSDGPFSIVGDDVELHLTRNSGASFSFFTNATVFLAVLALVLSIVLVRAIQRTRDRLTVVALALVLGGALGNLCDRIFRSPGFLRGHVVDFVRVGSFPFFNVADSAITIGAILLILATFRSNADDHEPARR